MVRSSDESGTGKWEGRTFEKRCEGAARGYGKAPDGGPRKACWMTSRACLVEVRALSLVLSTVSSFSPAVLASPCRDVKKTVNSGCPIEVLLGGCCE